MKKFKVLTALTLGTLLVACVNNPRTVENNIVDDSSANSANAKRTSWCQENYFSASVSSIDRENSARYCDSSADLAYKEAIRMRYDIPNIEARPSGE